MICPLCNQTIASNTPTIQFAGGFLQEYPDGKGGVDQVFVQESEILSESFTHKGCLIPLLLQHNFQRVADKK